MLAHIGWPTVALAVVYLIGRAIEKPDEWRRLMGTIVVLVAVVLGAMVICVEVLGMQLPGFNVPALTRTPAPVATASPQPSAPVTASPVATASPAPSAFTLVRVGEELDPCSEADELLLRALLARHGFDSDHRPHVCELDGVPVDGHEVPGRTGTCARCGATVL